MSIVLDRARIWTRMLPVFLLLFLLVPDQARAQLVATSFEELQALVTRGDTIDITDASGRRTKGRLGDLSASALELLVRQTAPDGRETFVPHARLSETNIRQILLERGDSLWNGTLIGMGAAALPSVYLISYGLQARREHYKNGANIVAGGIVVLGIGAGFGAMIDASLRKRTTVYYRMPGQASSGVRVSPLLSKSARGIQMAVRF
jgi:hypothetical protein